MSLSCFLLCSRTLFLLLCLYHTVSVLVVLCCCCYPVAKLCPIFCDPMNCSMPAFPVFHCLSEFAQMHVHWVGDAIQPSHPLSFPSPPAPSLSSIRVFPVSQLFTSGGQSIGVSASSSVLEYLKFIYNIYFIICYNFCSYLSSFSAIHAS